MGIPRGLSGVTFNIGVEILTLLLIRLPFASSQVQIHTKPMNCFVDLVWHDLLNVRVRKGTGIPRLASRISDSVRH